MPSFGNTIAGVQRLRSELQGAATDVDRFSESQKKASELVDQSRERFDVFGDLLRRSQAAQNDWSTEIELVLEKLRVGGDGLEKFRAQFGDAVIFTEKGTRTLKELLDGMDLDGPRIRVQELIRDLSRQGADLGEVITFLEENAGNLAKGLINVLKLFKEGKASLDDVAGALDAARQVFGAGSEFGGLADALENALAGELL